MAYEHYYKFNLSKNLGDSISQIISQNEEVDYVCEIINITIPEHKGKVFKSPLDGYMPYGGGLYALSGAQINHINEKYGKWVEGTIPAEHYSYLTIMDKKSFETFSKFSFKTEGGIKKVLNFLSLCYWEYNGVFNAMDLIEKFPYLKNFFGNLDRWRAEHNRVTLDDDIIQESIKKVVSKKKKSKVKK